MKNIWKNKKFGLLILSVLIMGGFYLIEGNEAIAQQNVVKWKCQTSIPMTTPTWKENILRVTELVKARTNGRLIIEPYVAGAVLPNDEIFPAVKRGMLEMGFSVPGYWKTDIPIFQVGSLPYAFINYWETMYFYKTLGFSKMLADQIAKHGVLYWDNRVTAAELVTKTPINSVNDLKGMKLRASAITSKWFSLIGAQPAVVAGPEIYTGLSMGVINGAHWGPAFSADSLGLYEVAKYHMKPSIYMGTEEGFFVNKKAFEKLPNDIQIILKDILDNEFWPRSLDAAYNAESALARVQKKHNVQVVTLPAKDQKILFAAAQKVWDEVASINAENSKAVEMLKKFNKDLGRID